MARALDLTGQRYGKLTVLQSLGHTIYGGRKCLLWQCRCECGNTLDLPAAKLPYSEANTRAAEKAGRLIYTSCETCRQKRCMICDEPFSYSHPSHICPRPECQRDLQDMRNRFWQQQSTLRYQSDAEFRQRKREYLNAWYGKHQAVILERRRLKWEALSEEEQAAIRADHVAYNRDYHAALKQDTKRWERRNAGMRQRASERLREQFIGDMQRLLGKRETDEP